jgi:hypothetical protein
VDKALAKTSAPREKLVSIDTEFLSMFESTDCVIHLLISNFLDSTLSEARGRIQDVFETDCKVGPLKRIMFIITNALFEDKIGKLAASSVRSASSVADQNGAHTFFQIVLYYSRFPSPN